MTDNNIQNTPLLSGRTYDFLVQLVQVVIPAFATLYFTMAAIADLPNPEGVVAGAAAVATFLGVLLKVSNKSYEASGAKYSGAINVAENEAGVKVFSLEFDGDPTHLDRESEVTFKVNSPQV